MTTLLVAPTPSAYPHRARSKARCLSSFSKSWVQMPTPPLLPQKGLNSTLPLFHWDFPTTHLDNEGVSESSLQLQPCTVLPGPGSASEARKKRSSPIQGETWAAHAPARPSTSPAPTRVRLRNSLGSEPRKLKLKLAFAERQILKR